MKMMRNVLREKGTIIINVARNETEDEKFITKCTEVQSSSTWREMKQKTKNSSPNVQSSRLCFCPPSKHVWNFNFVVR
ncbi:hypothetical protein GCK32_017826 [Trichostrongylus colubriformis]|uniref:Uncharacterized protein n=1 Tax=Trichostrongylus colubriformis TaxID=6319 RepID=A0AAN8FYU6_TRICO